MAKIVEGVEMVIRFKSSNAALVEAPMHETMRILGVIQTHIQCGIVNGPVMDLNGNKIGEWDLDIETTEEDE